MSPGRPLQILLAATFVVALPPLASEAREAAAAPPVDPDAVVWLDAEGKPLPFRSAEAVLEFLRDADVVEVVATLDGVTRAQKLLLERDGVRAHAVFRNVDVEKTWVHLDDGSFHLQLRDYDLFEVAAYRLSTLLGLGNVPPTVVRRVGAEVGSLQLWLENVISSGKLEAGLRPPDFGAWAAQREAMELFDYLVWNVDRNTGNYLYDANWKLWMIDHTRAFQFHAETPSPDGVVRCEDAVWERLLALDDTTVRHALADLLRPAEISGLLARLHRVREHFADLIGAHGKASVIY